MTAGQFPGSWKTFPIPVPDPYAIATAIVIRLRPDRERDNRPGPEFRKIIGTGAGYAFVQVIAIGYALRAGTLAQLGRGRTLPSRGPHGGVGNKGVYMAGYSSQLITYGNAYLKTQATAQKTAPTNPLINTGKVRLTTATGFSPSGTNTIAELSPNEANFSGYTAGGLALTLTGPVNLSALCEGMIAALTFLATTASPFVPNVLTGYWVDDGTNVIAQEAFPSPGITISAAGDFLALLLQLPQQVNQPCA